MLYVILLSHYSKAYIDQNFPYPCNSYVCKTYEIIDSTCNPLCMTPPCNYDSNDTHSSDIFPRFQASSCLPSCQNSGCDLSSLGVYCDQSCNSQICGFGLGTCGYCASSCTKEMLLNKVCDPECNTRACMYDNNACGWCAPGCYLEDLTSSECKPACANPDCNYQNLICNQTFCGPGCSPTMQNDSECQPECNVASCSYDNWKCACSVNCTYSMQYSTNVCYKECNNAQCGFQNGKCGDCASGCFDHMVGDQNCNQQCNTKECNYDWGDCSCAPGCSSTYQVATNDWTWDTENGGCKLDCLVEDCLFNYGVCNDAFLIKAAWFQQLIKGDIEYKLNLTECFNNNPECTEQKLRDIDKNGICYDACAKKECLYCMGLAEKNPTCARTFEFQCLICASTQQIYNYCYSANTCPEGYNIVTGLSDNIFNAQICFRNPQKFSANNYYGIYVNITGNDNNIGSRAFPVRTISAALQKCTRKFNKITIGSGNFNYTKEIITNPLVTDPYTPLNLATNLYIQDISIVGSSVSRARIFLVKDNMRFNTNAISLSFFNIIFNGTLALVNDCNKRTCMYCPSLLKLNGIVVDDRGLMVNNINDYAQNCRDFTSYNFISTVSGSQIYLKNVTVFNFQQQYATFIYTEGSLELFNVVFRKIQNYEANYFITVVCNVDCEKVSVLFYLGLIENLNYGYEYSDYLTQPGFLKVQNVKDVYLEAVTFNYVMVITGMQATTINYLISIKNALGTIMLNSCTFTNAFVNGILNIDSTSLSYTSFTIDSYLYVDQYFQWHLQFYYNTLRNIASLYCLICYKMGAVIQNLDIEINSFTNITALGKGLLNVAGANVFSNLEENGGWVFVKVNNEITRGWIDFRNISIINVNFTNVSYSGSFMSFTNQPSIELSNIIINNTSEASIYDVNAILQVFIKNPSIAYLSKELSPNTISTSECRSLVEITTSSVLSISKISLQFTSCANGSSGFIINTSNRLNMYQVIASSITKLSESDLFLFQDVLSILLTNTTLIDISQQTTSILRVSSSDQLIITNFTGINLSSLYKPCVSLERISKILLISSTCSGCGTSFGDGGAIYILPNAIDSYIEINSFACESCYATVGTGGGMYFESLSTNLHHTLKITDITFNNCLAADGAAIYLSSRLSLLNGIINNLLISNSQGISGGVLTDFHNLGKIICYGFTSINNSGFYSAIKAYYAGTGERLAINTVKIFNSKASEAIFYFTGAIKGVSVKITSGQIQSSSESVFVYGRNILLEIMDVKVESGLGLDVDESYVKGSGIMFTGLLGSAFSVDKSGIVCDKCIFNKISNGPALSIENLSNFSITNSVFTQISSKVSGIVLYMNVCPGSNLFENCTFIDNFSQSSSLIEIQGSQLTLNNCSIGKTLSFGITPGIYLLTSILNINNSSFHNQSGDIGSFIYLSTYSTVEAYNTTFDSGIATHNGGAIISIFSTFKATSCTFSNNQVLSNSGSGGVIYAMTSSNFTISGCNFINNIAVMSGSSIDFSGTALSITNSKFFAENSNSSIISLNHASKFTFEGSEISNSRSVGISALYIINFTVSRSNFTNLFKAISAMSDNESKSNVYFLNQCNFSNNFALDSGSALDLVGVSVLINNSTFYNNSAISGGAIDYSCPGYYCYFHINNSEFTYNKAYLEGGAIRWVDNKPIISDVNFTNNSAAYGSDSASFPTTLELFSSSRILSALECPPGQPCNANITLLLKDSAGNTMTLDNSSESLMSANNNNYSVSGRSKETCVNGKFTFSAFIISGKPGTEVNISISTSSIASNDASVSDGIKYENTVAFFVKLRNCTIGEQIGATSCLPCEKNSYLIEPAKSCKSCPNGGNCTGGSSVLALPGYWKPGVESDVVYSCPNKEACLGSLNTSDYVGSCFEGYTGNKCFSCDSGYSRSGDNKCLKCPPKASNIVILLALLIFLIFQGVILVVTTIKSAYENGSLYSIYLKIFTNYLQLIFLTNRLDLKWPWFVNRLFTAQNTISTSSDQIFSLDCYMEGSEYESIFFTKLFMMSILPLLIWMFSLVIWILFCLMKRKWKYLKKEFFTSMIVLFFLVYPNIVKTMFSVFSCEYINGTGYWMTDNLKIKCWDKNYVRREIAIALPSIIIWAIGTPTIVLMILHKRRRMFKEDSTRVIFGFLFNGYKQSRYYWEFLIMYRKIVIICITTFLAQGSKIVQGLTLISVLLVSLFLQDRYRPYNMPELNHMEIEGILTATITIYCGMYYLSEGIGEVLEIIFFVVIVLGNLYFVINWLYYMLRALIDLLSSSVYFIKRLVGKIDPYPNYVFSNELTVQGTYRDVNEGILTYTLFTREVHKPHLISLNNIQDTLDLQKRGLNQYINKLRDKEQNKSEDKSKDYEEFIEDFYIESIPQERSNQTFEHCEGSKENIVMHNGNDRENLIHNTIENGSSTTFKFN